jgi:hypothetical protein
MSTKCLVMYKGGGYDGCFWEWNYAYIDNNGKFHNIAATGCYGCETLKELKAAYRIRTQDFYFYYLPSEMERFSREAPISHLIGVAQWFAKNDPDIVFSVKCEECGGIALVIESQGDGLVIESQGDGIHGCGGITMEYDRIVCQGCAGECECCEV